LSELQELAAQGLLNTEQCARYNELMALVACYRPTVERLLASE
jgi:hypothetical protein